MSFIQRGLNAHYGLAFSIELLHNEELFKGNHAGFRTHDYYGQSFDTLAYAKRMETVGFTRQQAEALADEQGKLIDERLATKTDIELVRTDLEQLRITTKADVHEAELRLETRIAETKAQIIMWVMGIGFAQVVAQVAMILGIIKFHV